MQTNQTTNKLTTLEAAIKNLQTEIRRMKTVLPFIKHFVTRRHLAKCIRQYQTEIHSMKREQFEIKF